MFKFTKFYEGLLNRTNFFDNYMEKFPKGRLKKYKSEILSLFNENIKNKDANGLASTLAVAFLDGADKDYTDLLLYLLDQKWHSLQEDVISILELIKDPKSIDILYKKTLDIPDYDDSRSIAKKCIWALGAINTVESRTKLSALSTLNDSIIKNAAIEQLKILD